MLGREHVFGHPALTDNATGLANRLHFELVYSYLFHGADRGVPLTVLLLGLPPQTDEELHAFGEKLQRSTRASDLAAHLGHGRFIILFLGANMSGARIAADRIEQALDGSYQGALSMALAAYHPDMHEPHELLEAADAALRDIQASGGGLEMVSE
ncbi:MAG: diguanylate cyclase [Longimicrobiales bacterium]